MPNKLDLISSGPTFLSNLISLYFSIHTCPPFTLHLLKLTYLMLAHMYTFVPVSTLPECAGLTPYCGAGLTFSHSTQLKHNLFQESLP